MKRLAGDSYQAAGTKASLAQTVELVDSAGLEKGTAGNPVKIDPTGTTTQPVSGTVTANQGGSGGAPWAIGNPSNLDVALSTRLADSTFTGRINTLGAKASGSSTPVAVATDQLVTLGQATMAASVPVAIASDQSSFTVKVNPLATLVEEESLAPTSLASGTAETVEVAGTTALAAGQQVNYNLSAEDIAATAAGQFVYVAIKGATTGKYYAVCNGTATVTGSFQVSNAEKLNIVARNSDAKLAHVVSGYWQAMKP